MMHVLFIFTSSFVKCIKVYCLYIITKHPIADKASLSTVARAAPKTPKCKIIINIKSNPTFKREHPINIYKGVLTSPKDLIIPDNVL